jgi:prepilin signal peptidase PulO-like enzyme (type II secretory pathway)
MTFELLFVLLAGLAFGSFITCASYRLPLEQDIVKKPSYCPSCNTKLGFNDLWPVLSWVGSGGKCRHCKTSIPVRYPLIEIVTAFTFWLIYAQYGFTLQAAILMLFAVALLILIVTDLEHFIIPDQIHVFLLPLGLLYHFVIGTDWMQVLYGFLAGAGIGLALHHGYRLLRKKEGLGYGDVKFLAVVGVWLTFFPIVPFLFYSGLFGVVFGLIWRLLGNGEYFPFGPALAVSLFTGVVYPEWFAAFWNVGTAITQMIM